MPVARGDPGARHFELFWELAMQRVDFGDQAASPPAIPAASGTPGYFTDGSPPTTAPTMVRAASLNALQEELCGAITEFGYALDRTDNGQLAVILAERIKGIFCGDGSEAASDTAGVSVIATYRSKADGTRCVVIASAGATVGGGDVIATGTNSAVIACGGSGAASIEAAGGRSVIIASDGTNADPVTVDGTSSAAIAVSEGVIDSNSSGSALLAVGNCTVESGINCAGVASGGSQVRGSQSAILASTASETDDSGETSAIIAANGCITAANSQSAIVASENTELAEDNTIAGGYHASGITPSGANQNLTWKINSATGNIYIDGAVSTPAADFAEHFERLEGHPEIEPGYFVTLIPDPGQTGRMVAVKAGEGDTAVGIVPAKPGIIGNSPALWGRYLQDPLGKPILDENGGYQADPSSEPLGPTALVSLLGQVKCYTTGGIVAGDRVVPTTFGVGRKAEPGEGGYLVLAVSESDLDGPQHVATVLVR